MSDPFEPSPDEDSDRDPLPSRSFGSLRHRDFRGFTIGMLISQVGSQMQSVALNWHIYILTHSPLALGLMGLARIGPIVVLALLGGVIADARDRRRVLLVTQTVMLVLAAFMGFITAAGHATPMAVYLLAASTAGVMAFDAPARQALITNLVPGTDLANAVSINGLLRKIGTVVGPSLGGILIAWKGVAGVYWFNAVTFVAVLAALAPMRPKPREGAGVARVNLAALGEGLGFLFKSRIILATILADFIASFFGSANALLPIFANEILRVGPEGLGFLYAAEAVGAVAAGIWLSAARGVERKGLIQLRALAVYGAATAAFGISRSFPLALAALFVAGASDTVNTVLRNTLRQEATPDHFRGRMTSVNIIFARGGPQLGNLEAGALASAAGAPVSVVAGGLATIVAVTLVALRLPELRTYTASLAAGPPD